MGCAWPAASVIWAAGTPRGRRRKPIPPRLAFLPADRNLRWGNLFIRTRLPCMATTAPDARHEAQSNPLHGDGVPAVARSPGNPTPAGWCGAALVARRPGRPAGPGAVCPSAAPFFQGLAGAPIRRTEISKSWSSATGAAVRLGLYSLTLCSQRSTINLRSLEPGPAGAGDRKRDGGKEHRDEAWGSLQAAERWALSAGLLALHQDLHLKPGSGDTSGVAAARNARSIMEPALVARPSGRQEFGRDAPGTSGRSPAPACRIHGAGRALCLGISERGLEWRSSRRTSSIASIRSSASRDRSEIERGCFSS